MSTPSDIRLQVMWNRLLSVVEEQARALVRTAFSTSAREAGDISAGVFDLDGYLTPYSDIVALMVLEHQAHFANLVTRANYETRLGEESRIAEAADALADYMLFVDEAKIPTPIEGSSGFAEKFAAAGPFLSKRFPFPTGNS